MEDKLRELYEQAIKQERNKVYLAIEEETKYVPNESDKQDFTIDFLLEELDKFEAKYQEDRYLQIKAFAEGFNYALKKYGKLDFSEIIQISKDFYSQNHQELIVNNNPKDNPSNFKNENLTYELAIYNAWVEMSEARILTLDDPDLDVFDIGDYLAMDTALPKTFEEFVPGDLLEQFNSMEISLANIKNSISEMNKKGDTNDYASIYSQLYSELISKHNSFNKPLITDITEHNFISILLGLSKDLKINWNSKLIFLVCLINTMAEKDLIKSEYIVKRSKGTPYASNDFILSRFTRNNKEIEDQSIINARNTNLYKKTNDPKKELYRIAQFVSSIKV